LWVEQGEADSAVVYESDALSSAKVEIRSRLDSKDKPIIYPMAQCRSNNPKSRELYEALNQPLSTEIFRSFGFQIVMHERT
jgi:ABC-type molybdate transport system substrate-binding protein